jgi:hypothetical protein
MAEAVADVVEAEAAHVRVEAVGDAAGVTEALELFCRVGRVLAFRAGAVGVGEGEAGEEAEAAEAGEGVAVLGEGLGDLEEGGLGRGGEEGVGVEGVAEAGVGEGEVQSGEVVEVGDDFVDDVEGEGLEGGEVVGASSPGPGGGLGLRHGGGGRVLERGHVLGEEGEELG